MPFWQENHYIHYWSGSPLTFQPYMFRRIDNDTGVKDNDLSMLRHSWMSLKRVRFPWNFHDVAKKGQISLTIPWRFYDRMDFPDISLISLTRQTPCTSNGVLLLKFRCDHGQLWYLKYWVVIAQILPRNVKFNTFNAKNLNTECLISLILTARNTICRSTSDDRRISWFGPSMRCFASCRNCNRLAILNWGWAKLFLQKVPRGYSHGS